MRGSGASWRTLRRVVVAGLAALGVALPARAGDEGRLVLVRVDSATTALHVYLRDTKGEPWAQFDRLAADLKTHGHRLVAAMNAGMYQVDRSPVGLLVEDGRELHPLNVRHAGGNFYMQPNGVFAVTKRGPRLLTTDEYARRAPAGVEQATQSGPLLLRRGELTPAVAAARGGRFTRNGVCVDGARVTLAIADTPMSLREFAERLRDEAGCRDALYLDGAISKLYDARTGRDDRGEDMGPIFAVVE